MDEFIIHRMEAFAELLVFLHDFLLVGLRDEVQLIETAELAVVLLEMVFEMFAFVFEDPDLFHEVVELGAGGALLFPVGDVDLVFALCVGLDLYVLVETVGVALL